MAILVSTQLLLVFMSFLIAVWGNNIQVSGIDNQVVILSQKQSLPSSLAVRRVSGIGNRVTFAVSDRATIRPGVDCSNVNISSISGIDNRVSIIASPGGPGGCSNVNISSIGGIDNTVIIVSGTSVTLEDIAATLARYNSYRFPAESCSQISPAISGYYWIGNRSPKRVFCAFDPPQCGGEGVWRRIAKIDTTMQNPACPGNFTLVQSEGRLYCSSTTGNNCTLAQFHSQSFKEVCGVAHTVQISTCGCSGAANQLGDRLEFQYSSRYPRKETTLWTYTFATYDNNNCSCNARAGYSDNHYYCTPKCWYPNYPWFRRVFQNRVSGTVEMQLCLDQDTDAIAVDFAEIYIRED